MRQLAFTPGAAVVLVATNEQLTAKSEVSVALTTWLADEHTIEISKEEVEMASAHLSLA